MAENIRIWTSPRLRKRTKLIGIILGIIFAIDVAGTPLALVALNETNNNVTKATQQTIKAREDDCREQEVLRARGRVKLAKERAELPRTLALLHIDPNSTKPGSKVTIQQEAELNFKEGEVQLAPKNCRAYGHRDIG